MGTKSSTKKHVRKSVKKLNKKAEEMVFEYTPTLEDVSVSETFIGPLRFTEKMKVVFGHKMIVRTTVKTKVTGETFSYTHLGSDLAVVKKSFTPTITETNATSATLPQL